MRTVAAAVFCLLLPAFSAAAQAPFPGAVQVDGGWIPCDHPIALAAGKACGASAPNVPTPQTAPGLVDCDKVNPYLDPDRALACNLEQLPKTVPHWLPTFRVGQRYFGAYNDFQMVVLSIATSLEGVEVITFQWTASNVRAAAGDVDACRNDGRGGVTSCGVWLPHQP